MADKPLDEANYSMQRSDLWFLAGYPIYQFLGTAQHEWSHAAMAVMQRAHLTKVQLLPTIDPIRGLMMGYTSWTGGQTNWLVTAAPYFYDILKFGLAVLVLESIQRMPRWIWIHILILGVVSSWLDLAYNYSGLFRNSTNDMSWLQKQFSPLTIHLAVLVSLAVIGLYAWIGFRKGGIRRRLKS